MVTLTRIWICLYILGLQNSAFGAADTLILPKPLLTIGGRFSDVYVDHLKNIYLVSNKNRIKKINSIGDSLAVYNEVRKYGDIAYMDVANPLKLVLFYKEFSTIVVLDRFLNSVNTIDLRRKNILRAKAVALSYDNNYWIFDEFNSQLLKIDDAGNTLAETVDFRRLFTEPVSPDRILDKDGQLYLYDQRNGWYIFDYYGAFKNKIQAPGWENVSVENQVLSGVQNTTFYKTATKGFVTKSYNFQPIDNGLQKAYWQFGKLYILKTDRIAIFAVQE